MLHRQKESGYLTRDMKPTLSMVYPPNATEGRANNGQKNDRHTNPCGRSDYRMRPESPTKNLSDDTAVLAAFAMQINSATRLCHPMNHPYEPPWTARRKADGGVT
jgi:hypothetical protein